MPGFGFLSKKFFGNAVSETAAFSAGLAIAPTLLPLLQALENETWSSYPDKPPSAATMALGVAQGQVSPAQAAEWAKMTGYSQTVFDALVNVANVGPELASAYSLVRRGVWDTAQLQTAFHRMGIETQWWPGLLNLVDEKLDPADIARGIHKSLIPDPGLLAVGQPAGVGRVPAYPVYSIDALAEAMAAGIDKERLGVLVGLQGNPMGAHEAAQAFFRGILEQVDYDRAIAEGNTRNEWGEAIMEQSRQIPTSDQAVNNHLRGYSDQPTMYARTARHGMTQADTDIVFQNAGRPLNIHQITTGLARGGTFTPEPGELTDPYDAVVHESSLKPGYYDLAKANRYTLPGYFVIRAMLQAPNGISQADAAQLFREEGWPPDLADKAAAALAPQGAQADPNIKPQVTALVTATRKAYVGEAVTRAEAATALNVAGIDATAQADIFRIWDAQSVIEHTTPPAPA